MRTSFVNTQNYTTISLLKKVGRPRPLSRDAFACENGENCWLIPSGDARSNYLDNRSLGGAYTWFRFGIISVPAPLYPPAPSSGKWLVNKCGKSIRTEVAHLLTNNQPKSGGVALITGIALATRLDLSRNVPCLLFRFFFSCVKRNLSGRSV